MAHIHHHLRAASDEEWRFVEEYCQARGVRFHGRHVQVREKAQGRSLEAAAHTLRHAALAEILQERQAQWLALAHQADEYMSLDSLALNMRIFARAIEKLQG